MLVTRRAEGLLLIEQTEHGRVCGEICDRWGNSAFAPPARRESARIAAAMHDEGWREADAEPLFNPAAGRPLNFLEIDMSEHVPLYRRGVEQVSEIDSYAGLLVSMHWIGLYRGRWGLQSGGVFRSTGMGEAAQLQDQAVAEQEQGWPARKRDLMLEEARTDFEVALWHNYDLLQAFDLLSLYLCTADLAPAPDTLERKLTDVLGEIEPPPGPRVIGSVPDRPAGSRVELTLTPAGSGAVAVDPYPFDQPDVELTLGGRSIPDRHYKSRDALRAALDEAEPVTLVTRFVAG